MTLLAELGEEAKVLAGGQSLVPLLNMRLANPRFLVDINGVSELAGVEVRDDGVEVGALARQARVEKDPAVASANPLLGQALREVAHPVIRNRGTVVGSLVHADPAAEMPAILTLLGGTVKVRGASGEREIPAQDCFVGPLESSVAPDELAVSAFFPNPPVGAGTAFQELARRHGDYAMAGVAVVVTVDDGTITGATAGFVGVGYVPIVVDLGDTVVGQARADLDLDAAVELCRERIDPDEDIHATADYKRHLAGVLLERTLRQAAEGAV